MDNINYYDWNNLEHYLSKKGIAYDISWYRWVKDIINTKITMFSYENVEKYGLTSEIIEKALMFNNFLCYADVPGIGFGMYRWRRGSEFNMYWKPVTVELLTFSGRTVATDFPYENIVLCRDNPMDIIPFITLNSYIEEILEKEKTLDNIFTWLSLPVMLSGDKEQVAAFKQIANKAKMRDPFAFTGKKFSEHLETFDIKLPVELIEVYDIMKKYKGMALASMGIYEVDEKRERIVTSEIQAQNDYVDFVYTGMYNERKRAIEECNRKFGTQIRLLESYVENQKDTIELQRKMSLANKAGDMVVQEIENEGKVEVAKEGGNGNDVR